MTQTEVVRHDTAVARHGWPAEGTLEYESGKLVSATMPSGTVWLYAGMDDWGLPRWYLADGAWLPVRSSVSGEVVVVFPPGGAA